MPILEIDGIGKVEVGDGFTSMSPTQQAAEVDFMVQALKPKAPPAVPGAAPPAVAGAVPAPATAPAEAESAPGIAGSAGRVADRAATVAKDRFGDREFGLSKATIGDLVDRGVIAGEGQAPNPVQLLNQIVYQYGSKAGDLALRSIAAAVGGVQGAAGQTALEMGADQGKARRLERDVGMLADTIGVVAGTSPSAPKAARAVVADDAAVASAKAIPDATPAAGRPGMVSAAAEPAAVVPKTAAEFKAASQGFYKQAEDAGLLINPKSLETSVKELATDLKKGGLDPTLHADATAALKRLAEKRAEPVSLQDLDTLRQIAGDAAASPKAGERRLAGMIKDKIDDFVLGLTDKDVISSVGKPEEAVAALGKARDFWSKSAKLDKVADLVDRAQTSASGFSGSGFENALRTEFRSLAKNKSAMRTFADDEQAAIKRVARGGVLENTARNVGKLAPTGVVSMALGGGAGAALGSMIGMPAAGAVAVGGLGFAGRRLATTLTKRNIANLEKTIMSDGATKASTTALVRSRAMLTALEDGAKPIAAGQAAEASRRD